MLRCSVGALEADRQGSFQLQIYPDHDLYILEVNACLTEALNSGAPAFYSLRLDYATSLSQR